jgi:hypothetical protein
MGADWLACKLPHFIYNPLPFRTLFALLAAYFMLALSFDTEDGSAIFIQNVG